MKSYKFIFNEKIYELSKDNCSYLINDEEHPVVGIENSGILDLLSQSDKVNFDIAHYDQSCGNCLMGKAEKSRHFKFLEYYFYIFTKKCQYVISSISKEYKDTSFNKLLKKGKVDNSYIVSIIVCANCGAYSIEIEQCDV